VYNGTAQDLNQTASDSLSSNQRTLSKRLMQAYDQSFTSTALSTQILTQGTGSYVTVNNDLQVSSLLNSSRPLQKLTLLDVSKTSLVHFNDNNANMTFDDCIAGCDIIPDCQSVVYHKYMRECDIFTCRAPIEYLTPDTPCAVRKEYLDNTAHGTLYCPQSAFQDLLLNAPKWDRQEYYIVELAYGGLLYRVYCNRSDCMRYCRDMECPGLVNKEIWQNGMAALCKYDEWRRRSSNYTELPCRQEVDGVKTNLIKLNHPIHDYVKVNQAPAGMPPPELDSVAAFILVPLCVGLFVAYFVDDSYIVITVMLFVLWHGFCYLVTLTMWYLGIDG
jgi:hypothetical protein